MSSFLLWGAAWRRRRNSTPVNPVTSGLAVELIGDNISGANAAAVASWPDSSGNARHATQATGTKQPTKRTSVLNGHAVARFDGGDVLQTAAVDWTARRSATVFVVAGNHTNTADQQCYVEFGTATFSQTTNFLAYRVLTTNVPSAYIRGTPGGICEFQSYRTVTSAYRAISFAFDKSSTLFPTTGSITGKDALVYLDGLQANGNRGWASGATNTNFFGNLQFNIGARNNGAALFMNGDIAEMLIYDRLLTGAEHAQVTSYLRSKYALTHANGTLIFEGDSITNGTNATSPYPEQAMALIGGDWAYGNFGIDGQQLSVMNTRYTAGTTFKHYYNLQGGKNIVVLYGGSNDMAGGVGNQSAATAYSRLGTYAAELRAAGWKVVVVTALARTDANAGGSFETRRQAFNTSVRAGWSTFADALVDLSTDVRLDDGTGTLPVAVDSGDLVHPNNTGLGYIAALVQPAVAAL